MTLLTWHYEKAKLQGEKTISEQAWKEQRNRKVQNNMVSDKKKPGLYDDGYISLDLVNPWLWAKSRV